MIRFIDFNVIVILFLIILAISSIIKNTINFFKNINKPKSDEEVYLERSSFKHKRFTKFNLTEDIEPIVYLVWLISNEYVESNILNYHEDKVGDNSIRIPPTNKEHQKNINKITELVLDTISDDHFVYLTKYIDIERIKFIVRIYVKQNYHDLLEDAMNIRVRSEEQRFQNIKQDNSNKEKNLPNNIKQILNKYNIDLNSAKKEVMSYNINSNKLNSLSNNDPEKEFGFDILQLQKFFNKK
ncbi:MAG: hypothetical protein ACOCRK_03185 [bacterium]